MFRRPCINMFGMQPAHLNLLRLPTPSQGHHPTLPSSHTLPSTRKCLSSVGICIQPSNPDIPIMLSCLRGEYDAEYRLSSIPLIVLNLLHLHLKTFVESSPLGHQPPSKPILPTIRSTWIWYDRLIIASLPSTVATPSVSWIR
jgi:hypothetical protein